MDQMLFKSIKSKPPSSQKKKSSPIPKRSFSASTTSLRGLENDPLMSLANLSSSNYLKNVGMLDFVRSSVLESMNRTTKKLATSYRTPEEYHDEVMALKKKIKEMNSEMSSLKFKVRRTEDELGKRQKLIAELMSAKTSEGSSKAGLDSNIMINNLKLKIAKVEEKYREKESELKKLQSDIRVTNVQEMEIAIETLKNEILRLNKLLESEEQPEAVRSVEATRKQRTKSAKGRGAEERIKELTSTILKMSTDKNRLLLENKSLKIDLQKSMELHESAKKNFEAALERAGHSVPPMTNGNGPHPSFSEGRLATVESTAGIEAMKRHHEKEKELEAEVDRLNKIIIKIKGERNFYRDKCSTMEKGSETSRNGRRDSSTQSPNQEETSVRKSIAKKSPMSSARQRRRKKSSLRDDDVEFIQSLMKNHKQRHDSLHGIPRSTERSLESDTESLVEAVGLIQSLARNGNARR